LSRTVFKLETIRIQLRDHKNYWTGLGLFGIFVSGNVCHRVDLTE